MYWEYVKAYDLCKRVIKTDSIKVQLNIDMKKQKKMHKKVEMLHL